MRSRHEARASADKPAKRLKALADPLFMLAPEAEAEIPAAALAMRLPRRAETPAEWRSALA
jgi:Lon protease-like protein